MVNCLCHEETRIARRSPCHSKARSHTHRMLRIARSVDGNGGRDARLVAHRVAEHVQAVVDGLRHADVVQPAHQLALCTRAMSYHNNGMHVWHAPRTHASLPLLSALLFSALSFSAQCLHAGRREQGKASPMGLKFVLGQPSLHEDGPRLHDLGDKAHVCNGPPLHGQAGQLQRAPQLHQLVHCAIGIRIVGLACARRSAHSCLRLLPCCAREGRKCMKSVLQAITRDVNACTLSCAGWL